MSFWFYSSVLSLGKQSDTFPWVRSLGKWCLAGSISWIRPLAKGPPDPCQSCLILLRFGFSIVFGRLHDRPTAPLCVASSCVLFLCVDFFGIERFVWKKTKQTKSCCSVDKGERNQRKGYCCQTTITLKRCRYCCQWWYLQAMQLFDFSLWRNWEYGLGWSTDLGRFAEQQQCPNKEDTKRTSNVSAGDDKAMLSLKPSFHPYSNLIQRDKKFPKTITQKTPTKFYSKSSTVISCNMSHYHSPRAQGNI